jgi:hypothetical protein
MEIEYDRKNTNSTPRPKRPLTEDDESERKKPWITRKRTKITTEIIQRLSFSDLPRDILVY